MEVLLGAREPFAQSSYFLFLVSLSGAQTHQKLQHHCRLWLASLECESRGGETAKLAFDIQALQQETPGPFSTSVDKVPILKVLLMDQKLVLN